MNTNPYVEELLARADEDGAPLEALDSQILAVLAVAHEIGEANAPLRVVATGEVFQEDLDGLRPGTVMAIPDESGDARIAAAARRWAEAYGRRNTPGPGRGEAASRLAASELLEAVRQEGER